MTTNNHRSAGKRRSLLFSFTALVGAVGLGAAAWAQEVGELVVVGASTAEDFYGAARVVRVEAAVDGDVVVAGGVVDIAGPIAGDVLATGETVTLVGPLQDDVRVAGRSVTLTGEVGDHAILVGETVTLSSASRVDGYAWLAGRTVEVAGAIGERLSVAGEAVYLTGTIGGDVWVDANRITLGEHTRIGGDISWPAGHAPVIPAGAQIVGRQIERPAPPTPGWGLVFLGRTIFGTLALMVLTATTALVLRPWLLGATAGTARPGPAIGVGLLTLFVAPMLGVAASMTVIGLPVGVAMLLAYLLLLVISVPVALLELVERALAGRGGWAKTSIGRRIGAIALASLAFMLAFAVPWLGLCAGVVVLALGLGTLVLRVLRGQPGAR